MDLNLSSLKRFVRSSNSTEMPSRDQFWSLVAQFFTNFYPAFPIFPYEWLIGTKSGNREARKISESEEWACFNVILAISYHLRAVYTTAKHENQKNARGHLRSALAATEELLSGPPSMTTVQILIGIGVAVHGMIGPNPSSVLFAAAMRDSYRLGLHRRAAFSSSVGLEGIEQRKRVFWTTYSLHRGISLQLDLPMVFDDEIDLELPETSYADDVSLLHSHDRKHTFDIYRARTQLAVIQGQIRRGLPSSGQPEVSSAVVVNHVTVILLKLTEWRNNLPIGFDVNFLVQNFDLSAAIHVVSLHSNYFHCLRVLQCSVGQDKELQLACEYALRSISFSGPSLSQSYVHCARQLISSVSMFSRIDFSDIQGLLDSFVAALRVLTDCTLEQRSDALLQEDIRHCRPLVELLDRFPSRYGGRDVDKVLEAYRELNRITMLG